MGEVFIGSEALAAGRLAEHEVRWYRRIYPDVYVPELAEPTLRDRTIGGWLWYRREAVVAGVAASALHGACWVDDDTPIELIDRNARRHPGLVVRNETLCKDEVTWAIRLPVKRHRGAGTTALRAALPLVDGGAAAPKETWLRLLIRDHGFPTPTTQIPVEYDGDHHRTDRQQYAKDQRRLRRLKARGPIVIRVVAEDRVEDIIAGAPRRG